MKLFITGTDTEVGKTYVASLIVKELVGRGEQVTPFKPVCCGDRQDVMALWEASGRSDLDADAINPVWLKSPTAPLVASLIENRTVDMQQLIETGKALAQEPGSFIVEGAGGWEVPATSEHSMADLAVGLGLPVLVVVDNKLGAINHTTLTVNAIRGRGLPCLGIVLNHPREERDAASISNRMVFEDHLQIPVLDELMHDNPSIDLDAINDAYQAVAAN